LFLWLDCCHSGGILKRRATAGPDQNARIVKRTLKATGGTGRVIIAACTQDQFAYESASAGHGLFTDALVRGLKGEAEFNSEVTANSLYLFIDREIGCDRQRPMFFGEMAGRIVLMQARGASSVPTNKPTRSAPKKTPSGAATKSSGRWIMLGDQFFESTGVRQNPNNTYSVEVSSKSAADDAAIQGLQPPHGYGGGVSVAFAHGNDACDANVESIASESVGLGKLWTIELKPIESQGGFYNESTMNEGSRTYSPADIAELRARRMLLNDPLEELQGVRSRAGLSMVLHSVEHDGRGNALESPIQAVYDAYKTKRAVWPKLARLRALYALKNTGTVEHILNLAIGPVRGKKVRVRFRGQRRKSYSNEPAPIIECDGTCELA